MVNSQVVAETINAFKIDQQVEKIPNPIPVIEVGMKLTENALIASLQSTNSSSGTLLAASSTVEVYLLSACMTLAKDASATSISFRIFATINGVSQTLLRLPAITLQAGQYGNTIVFLHPIKIDKGTAVSFDSTNSTGNFSVASQLSYYVDEVV